MTLYDDIGRTLCLFGAAFTAGILLIGCGTTEESPAAEPAHFENVDELFEAVDEQLDCPEHSSGDYGFDTGEESGVLLGRSCADSVVMVFSEDETVISNIQEMMATAQGGTLRVAHNTSWMVADITEVAAGGQNADLAQPGSRDLETLAEAFGGTYSEHE